MLNLAVNEFVLELANSTQSTKSTKLKHEGERIKLYGPNNESESGHEAVRRNSHIRLVLVSGEPVVHASVPYLYVTRRELLFLGHVRLADTR